jgi:CheY-like chemotaxis protein
MPSILIAEDELDIRNLIAFTLRFNGYEVTAAANGEEAVAAAAQAAPDLILLDVRMPRMDGYEACRQIKLLPGLERVPVVFLSAKGQDEEIRAGFDAGAYEYLVKPFSIQELAERVKEILANASLA